MKHLHSRHVFFEGRLQDLVIECEDDGRIISTIHYDHLSGEEQEVVIPFDGILCPGFINTHCHLELSHLKGEATPGKGMTSFISEIIPLRNKFPKEQISKAIVEAEQEMLDNGIVAVGDICNTDHTFEVKAKKRLYYRNFIELFDLHPSKAEVVFRQGQALMTKAPGYSSLVPHAPYTVTPALLHLIAEEHIGKKAPVCIHSQESLAESEFFSRSGPIYEAFMKMNMDLSWIPPGRKSSLEYFLSYLMHIPCVQLVHNTYTSEAGFDYIKNLEPAKGPISRIFLCTCPNANLFIENKLPDYSAWVDSGFKITVGTDSYASNSSLSILDELKTIHSNFPNLKLEALLTWATINGAEYLGMSHDLGSFESTRKPGIIHIEGVDMEMRRLTKTSRARRIL